MHAATGRNGSWIRPMGNHGMDQILSEKRLTTIPLPQLRMSAFSVFLSMYRALLLHLLALQQQATYSTPTIITIPIKNEYKNNSEKIFIRVYLMNF